MPPSRFHPGALQLEQMRRSALRGFIEAKSRQEKRAALALHGHGIFDRHSVHWHKYRLNNDGLDRLAEIEEKADGNAARERKQARTETQD